jgi:hypothetical protein
MVSAASDLIVPWQEFINPVDLMVSDPFQNPCEPCLCIDAIELGGLNQGIDNGCRLTAAL